MTRSQDGCLRRSVLMLALAAGPLVFSPGAAAQESPPAQGASSEVPATPYRPRVWPLVVGSLIFVPMYSATVYWAFSGDATSYGRISEGKGQKDLGSPGLLLIPVFGPLMFHPSFCVDAKKQRDDSGELDDACRSNFWTYVAGIQALGVAFIVGGFLSPTQEPSPASSRIVLTPFAQGSRIGISAVGAF